MKKYIHTLIAAIVFTGCNSYLDELPDNRAVIDSKKEIASLLASAYANAQHAGFTEPMSDNADDKGSSANFVEISSKAYKWEDFTTETGSESTTNFWDESYQAIAHANQALNSIEKLGDKKEFSALKGEALVARAYNHFMLASIFCFQYDPATASTVLGIPYAREVETTAVKYYKRETLQETYNLIEQDLIEGLALVRDEYDQPKFHFGTKASNAFAARFYLNKAEWTKVIEHANKVIGTGNPSLEIRDLVSSSVRSLSYSQTTELYSASQEKANLLIGWVNSLYGRNYAGNRYGLSNDKTVELLGNRRNPFQKNWGYRLFGTDRFYNIPKYTEYFKYTNASAGIGFAFASFIHFTTDEVLLNRAEANAMLGNFTAASADLKAFLSQKTLSFNPTTDNITLPIMQATFPKVANEYTPFYTLTDEQLSFVKGIAEFRRREFLHEGHRWFDIKRFNLEVTHKVENQKIPIILKKDDLRRAVQLPEAVLTFGVVANER
ncbi:MAG: RagB/SusD family nutrient uptake outer membrane protein [Cyclobacteriaceae bacterium]|nr:RagB/SusD family nutrient uptake outer membrane protein [Cyclobacteriaceae bacterium]